MQDMGLGLSGKDVEAKNFISIGLGSLPNGVSVLDMARAYAPLANGGKRVRLRPIRRLVRADGKATNFKAKTTRIFSDGVAAEVTKILQQNVRGGTGTRAQLGTIAVAGKTGTESGNYDAWFVGYTPRYVTAVWVGYPENRRRTVYFPGYGTVEGGDLPAEIWHDFMAIVTEGEPAQSFPEATTPVEWQRFSSYWTRQASALAAIEAKKKAEAEAKKKEEEEKAKEEEEQDDDKGGAPGTPATPTTPAPTPAPAPAPAPPPTP
jgi:membrane peptidoglycan carboxypeptidase